MALWVPTRRLPCPASQAPELGPASPTLLPPLGAESLPRQPLTTTPLGGNQLGGVGGLLFSQAVQWSALGLLSSVHALQAHISRPGASPLPMDEEDAAGAEPAVLAAGAGNTAEGEGEEEDAEDAEDAEEVEETEEAEADRTGAETPELSPGRRRPRNP